MLVMFSCILERGDLKLQSNNEVLSIEKHCYIQVDHISILNSKKFKLNYAFSSAFPEIVYGKNFKECRIYCIMKHCKMAEGTSFSFYLQFSCKQHRSLHPF